MPSAPVCYTNRKGQTYFLRVTTTRTGKTRYVFSRSRTGTPVARIPEGFEIAESPNGVVSLRKVVPQLVSEFEVAVVRKALSAHKHLAACRVEARGDTITVYAPLSMLDDDFASVLPGLSERQREEARAAALKRIPFDPVVRFVLVDQEERRFMPERMTYRGDANRWMNVGVPGLLVEVVSLVKHVGKDSFYDLL